MKKWLLIAIAALLVGNVLLYADTLKLKDGTVLTGKVIVQGDKYWIKLEDGTSKLISKSDVVSHVVGSGAPSSKEVPGKASGGAGASGTSTKFAAVKAKADKVETPINGIGIWQSFIDAKASGADLEAARAELEKWQKLSKDGAEKINGKWIGGEERKKLLAKVKGLVEEAIAAEDGQMLKSVQKYEEAIKIYPRSFEAHFRLGYFNLVKGGNKRYDQAIKSLEAAVKIDPGSPEALSNLSIAYNFRDRYELAVVTAYKAVKITDNKDLVQNLINTIARAPFGMQRNNSKVRPIMDEAKLLANKHGIGGPGGWTYLPPGFSDKQGDPDDPDSKGPPGVMGNGTGFFVSSDGYIMTNEHVAKPGDYLMVKMSDGTQKVAKRIIIDDEQDIAIIKIQVDSPVPYVKLAAYDSPKVGADVAIFGFPLLSKFGLNSTVKVTRGIVTAFDADRPECDVTVDAQVNPGNSGGPMVDRYGNLLALVAQKTVANQMESSYGLGMSTKKIRTFVEKQQSKFPDLMFDAGSDNEALSTEELVDRLTPATVCILIVNGEDPSLSDESDPGATPDPAGKAEGEEPTPGKK